MAFNAIIGALLLASTTIVAQDNYVDSLRSAVALEKNPEVKIELLAEIMREQIRISPHSAFETSKELKELIDSVHSDLGYAHYYRLMGALSYVQGNFLYSTSFVFRSIELYSSLKDSVGIANSYVTLANSYSRQELYPQAITYQKLALGIFKRNGIERREGVAFSNLSYLYNRVGKYDSGKILAEQAIAINEKINAVSVLINDFKNLGESYYLQRDFHKAVANFEKALSYAEQTWEINTESLIEALLGLSMAQAALNNTDKALQNAKQAIALASQYGYLNRLEDGYKLLSGYYKKMGNLNEAYQYLEHYTAVIDSLKQLQRNEREALGDVYMASLRESHQNEMLLKEKALQEALIRQQRLGIISAIVSIALLGLLVFYLKQSNTRRREINKMLNEQKEEIAQKNEELKKLNQTKDKFFSIVAHDLRSPLNSLKGFTEILHKHPEELTKHEIAETGKQIDVALTNTIKMADNLITWAKQQMKMEEFKPEPVAVDKVIQNVINIYKDAAEQKQISIGVALIDTPVISDRDQLNFVIRNLVNNAIKFTHPGGQIHIAIKQANANNVTISIKDSGVGMDASTLAKLFDLNKTKFKGTAGEKGTGLGLILCKEFIEKNQGTLSVESEPGKGSTFLIQLPAGHS